MISGTMEYIMYGMLFLFFMSTVWLFLKFRQIRPFFDTMTKGGVLMVVKTLKGDRRFDRAITHGNSLHSEHYGVFQLSGNPEELERMYGMNAYFGHEMTAVKPTKDQKVALSLLDKAISDPNNEELVKEAVFRADGVLSKAIREPTFMSYNRIKYGEDGKPETNEDNSPKFEIVTVKYPSLVNVLLSEFWANTIKRMIGVFQNPYEVKEIINITELETIEKMKTDKGFSEVMKWLLPIIIVLVVGIILYKMVTTGSADGAVNAVGSAAGAASGAVTNTSVHI